MLNLLKILSLTFQKREYTIWEQITVPWGYHDKDQKYSFYAKLKWFYFLILYSTKHKLCNYLIKISSSIISKDQKMRIFSQNGWPLVSSWYYQPSKNKNGCSRSVKVSVHAMWNLCSLGQLLYDFRIANFWNLIFDEVSVRIRMITLLS